MPFRSLVLLQTAHGPAKESGARGELPTIFLADMLKCAACLCHQQQPNECAVFFPQMLQMRQGVGRAEG